jgi:hypothetical protein
LVVSLKREETEELTCEVEPVVLGELLMEVSGEELRRREKSE